MFFDRVNEDFSTNLSKVVVTNYSPRAKCISVNDNRDILDKGRNNSIMGGGAILIYTRAHRL